MTVSQNGWQAFTQYGDPHLTSNAGATVPGTSVMILGGLLAGDVATVMLHVAARFNDEVEPLVQAKGLWGFEPRDIIGSSVVSNHSSGTAMDLNSTDHPLGVHGTFSLSQVGAIHLILGDMRGVVRWGGDYSGRVDEMHFEINADAAAVAAVARGIKSTPVPVPVPVPVPIVKDDDMFTLIRSDQGNGAVFACAPGRFFHVADPAHFDLGVKAGLWTGAITTVGLGDLDVIRDSCIGNDADKGINFLDVLPSDYVQGKVTEPTNSPKS